MDKCPKCDEYWVSCPCCRTSFCPNCGVLESDLKKARKESIIAIGNKACDRNDEALKKLND